MNDTPFTDALTRYLRGGEAVVLAKEAKRLENRVNELESALRLSVDAMETWFSSEYIEHQKTKECRKVLDNHLTP